MLHDRIRPSRTRPASPTRNPGRGGPRPAQAVQHQLAQRPAQTAAQRLPRPTRNEHARSRLDQRAESPCERRRFLQKNPYTSRLLHDEPTHYYTRDPFFIVHPPKPYLLTRSALDALRVTAWLRPTQRTHADQQSGAPATRTGRRAPWGQDERQDSDWELNQ